MLEMAAKYYTKTADLIRIHKDMIKEDEKRFSLYN